MKYMGSKGRIAKLILPLILKNRGLNQWYVEPFVGGANMIDKVNGNRIGADVNPYLIECWLKLQTGWMPPIDIPRDVYNTARDIYNKADLTIEDMGYIGYIGFSGSYGGRFFEGGYAGTVTTKNGSIRNYPREAYNNVVAQIPHIRGIKFECSEYHELEIPDNSIIYCDPPYNGTKEYAKSGFDSEVFWNWCREKVKDGHKVFVSEYNAPPDFECIWERGVSSSLSSNGKFGGNKKSVERLFTFNN